MFNFTFSKRITSYFNGMNFHTFSSCFMAELKSWCFFKLKNCNSLEFTITENFGRGSSYLAESSNESLRRNKRIKTLVMNMSLKTLVKFGYVTLLLCSVILHVLARFC